MKKIIFILAVALSCMNAHAQDSTKQNSKWDFLIEPYLMFPNMNGKVGLGTIPDVPVDANPGDIFNHLQMGAMLYLEAHNNKWAITSDFLYMKLKQDVSATNIINSGKATAKQTMWELAGLYKINPWLEVGAGTRLSSIGSDVEVNYKTGPNRDTARSGSITKTWVDPIIVTRFTFFTTTKWIAQLRTDIGGFGIGSKFAWQIQADAGYRFSKLFQATIGYRYIDINYEKGSDSDRFLYDMASFGPTVRFGFNF
ncbi:MAG TPA: hypothetical protein VFV68_11425 [Agriterribacter sp.]|nr:hypothetical protein [Agriterribacter sp.]